MEESWRKVFILVLVLFWCCQGVFWLACSLSLVTASKGIAFHQYSLWAVASKSLITLLARQVPWTASCRALDYLAPKMAHYYPHNFLLWSSSSLSLFHSQRHWFWCQRSYQICPIYLCAYLWIWSSCCKCLNHLKYWTCLVALGKQGHPRLMTESHGLAFKLSHSSYEYHVAQYLWLRQFKACLPLSCEHFSWHLDLGIQRESCCFDCAHSCANSSVRLRVWFHWSWQHCSIMGTTLPLALEQESICHVCLFHIGWTFHRRFIPLLGFDFKL